MEKNQIKYLMQNPILRKILFILLAFVFVLEIFFIIKQDISIMKTHNWADFDLYYTASNVLKQKENPYNLEYSAKIAKKLEVSQPDTVYNNIMNSYTAAPDFVILMRPFTLLKYQDAVLLWLIVNNVLLALSAFLIGFSFRIKKTLEKEFLILIIFSTLFFSHAGSDTLRIGNNSIFLFFLICIAFYLLQNKRSRWAGIPAALALITKPIGGILFIILALRKRFKSIIVGIISLIILASVTILYTHSFGMYSSYIKRILEMSDIPIFTDYSLREFIIRFTGYQPLFLDFYTLKIIAIAISIIFIIYGIVAIYKNRREKEESLDFEFSMMLIIMLLYLPIAHESYYFYLLIPFVYLFKLIKQKKVCLHQIILFILSYILIYFINSADLFFFNYSAELISSGAKVLGTIILMILMVNMQKKTTVIISFNRQQVITKIIYYIIIVAIISFYSIGIINKQLKIKGKIIASASKQQIDAYQNSRNISYYKEYNFIHPKEFDSSSEAEYKFDLPENLISAKIKAVFSLCRFNDHIKFYTSQDNTNYKLAYSSSFIKNRETLSAQISNVNLDNNKPLYLKVEMYVAKSETSGNADTRLQSLELETLTKK